MAALNNWYILLGAAALLCAALGVGMFLYYRALINRMDRMLDRYQNGAMDRESLAETRESKLESKLRRLLRRSETLQDQAKKDREGLASLLSDLSHQLKTPLSNIVMDAELLSGGGLTQEEQSGFVGHIHAQATKMQWLVASLVKSSRLEHGIMQLSPEMSGIRRTLAKSVSAVYAQSQTKEISIELEQFEDCALYHDERWTAEAITNILENAVKYSPQGSVIQIRAQRLELYTRIDICDRGPGIRLEEYTKIFQRFYRGSSSAKEEGTGLGLYLAQVILSQEKGYITCASNPDGGSCFSVFLLNDPPTL